MYPRLNRAGGLYGRILTSVVCTDRTHLRPRSRFSHKDRLSSVNKMFILWQKRIYLLFEIPLRKNFLIRINPRFSVPRRNLENSSKTPPRCCTAESEENGSSSCNDVYPGRSNISRPLIQFLEDDAKHIRKVRRNAFQRCYRLLQQYPRFKERYTIQFNRDDRSIVQ